jgi:hypothetical protein
LPKIPSGSDSLIYVSKACHASCFYQRFDAVAIETFAGGKGFGREAAVNGRFNAQHKLAAECFRPQSFRQWRAVSVKQPNPFLDDFAEFSTDLASSLP